jgi:dolichol-phosphate mannosyltransferase
VVVDDGSTDQTAARVQQSMERHPGVRLVTNTGRHGFGMAVRAGLAQATGEALAVMMADGSDSPEIWFDTIGSWKRDTIARLAPDLFAAAGS